MEEKEKKNRIVHVLMAGSSPAVRGGMSGVAAQLLQHDWGQQIRLQYVVTHDSGSAAHKCITFLRGYLRILGMLLLHRDQVDVVHMHMSYKGSFYRKYWIHRLVKRFGKKDIIHLHGSEFKLFYDSADASLQSKIRRLLRECDRILVLGDYWMEVIRQIEPRSNPVIFRNSVPIPNKKTGWNPETFHLLYLGVLIERKGIADLLQAVHILKEHQADRTYPIRLMIAGTGEQEHELRQLCDSLGVADIVSFLGWIDGSQKEALLTSAQCLVLPSCNEGLPMSVLEALSYSVPVIATDVGSVSDAVADGQNGYLVEVHAPEQLAETIAQLSANPGKWEQISQNARQTALDRFDERQCFAQLQNLYIAMTNGEKME